MRPAPGCGGGRCGRAGGVIVGGVDTVENRLRTADLRPRSPAHRVRSNH